MPLDPPIDFDATRRKSDLLYVEGLPPRKCHVTGFMVLATEVVEYQQLLKA
jgi:hypothetical protein